MAADQLTKDMTMQELLAVFLGAQRALFNALDMGVPGPAAGDPLGLGSRPRAKQSRARPRPQRRAPPY